jgi:8-hydroxy-5-deazaflavin:NADPH oxidoreductase
MKTIAILGTGVVSQALALGFKKYGYAVVIGTQHPEKKIEWKDDSLKTTPVVTYQEAVKKSEMVLLAVKGTAAESVIKAISSLIANKTVIDATNPIADAPPEGGVLKFFTNLDESLMEQLQKISPQAHFVKAFNSVGNAFMVNPDFGGQKPTMFICGNDDGAKKEVSGILNQFGWETEDMGGAPSARAIEPLCMLWCIPGLQRNQWSHAFKLLKK